MQDFLQSLNIYWPFSIQPRDSCGESLATSLFSGYVRSIPDMAKQGVAVFYEDNAGLVLIEHVRSQTVRQFGFEPG